MSSIVIDYRKCVSIITHCARYEEIKSCINLVSNFGRKHRDNSTGFARYLELTNHLRRKSKIINCIIE